MVDKREPETDGRHYDGVGGHGLEPHDFNLTLNDIVGYPQCRLSYAIGDEPDQGE